MTITGNENDATFTFVLDGTPLTTMSTSGDLNRVRNELREKVQGLGCFPVPANLAIGVHYTLSYPSGFANTPGISDIPEIAREITIGILFVDNSQICDKKARRAVAETGDGATRIQIQLL